MSNTPLPLGDIKSPRSHLMPGGSSPPLRILLCIRSPARYGGYRLGMSVETLAHRPPLPGSSNRGSRFPRPCEWPGLGPARLPIASFLLSWYSSFPEKLGCSNRRHESTVPLFFFLPYPRRGKGRSPRKNNSPGAPIHQLSSVSQPRGATAGYKNGAPSNIAPPSRAMELEVHRRT